MATKNQGTDEKKETTDWQTMVRCYKRDCSPPYKESKETIAESDFCVKFPDIEGGPVGRPIDANLAVNLIRNLYDEVDKVYGPKNDSDIDKLGIDELKAAFRAARDFLDQIAGLNYGMTIDKNFALKLLSQPKCDGLRGYLCYKGKIDAPFSLVTVGVDENGYDLKYNLEKTVEYQVSTVDTDIVLKSINAAPAVKSVKMRSLNGEYVTPPYSIAPPSADHLSRFVLLNIATGNQQLLKMSNSI